VKKKLAIIGASYLQVPLVERAKAMGIETHCFAWADRAVCKDVADYFYPINVLEKEQILKECQRIKIDGITTIATDIVVPTINYVAKRMGLISNPDDYSYVTTNKYLMRKCFAKNDIPSPKFVDADTNEPDITNMNFPMIVKPTDRSGSIGIEKVYEKEGLIKAVKRARSFSFKNEAIVEEFIDGCEVSVESISWKGRHYILQITDKVTTEAPYFVELEHHEPSQLPIEIQNRIREIVLKALDALHVQYGASHSELKITKNADIRVMEIGARMGGDFIGSKLVQLSTGYDFLKGVIKVALGQFEEPIIDNKNYSGVYFLCKETERILPIIQNSTKYPEIIDSEIQNLDLKSITCSNDRSGFLIYQTKDHKFII
jgi:biotin carboxylase